MASKIVPIVPGRRLTDESHTLSRIVVDLRPRIPHLLSSTRTMKQTQIESPQSLRRKSRPLAAAISATILLFSGIARADPPAAHHWTYSGETGPAHWASEDAAFATCSLGKAQSPVDIEKTKKLDLLQLKPVEIFVTRLSPCVSSSRKALQRLSGTLTGASA